MKDPKGRIIIADDIHTVIIPQLESIGYEVDYRPEIYRQELLQILKDYVGLIIRSKTVIDEELLIHAKSLQFIARAGAGLDLIDVYAAEERNIKIFNAPEGNRAALAEHMVGMLLALLNKINLADQQVKMGIWDREANRGIELNPMTVGIIGYGFMGSAFARVLSGFGCNIIAYDKYKSGFSNDFLDEVSLDDIFTQADVVSFHVPLTSETNEMANEKFFDAFQKNIYILNSARGEILPLDILKVQLSNGKVLGAALDVHAYEKKKVLNLHEEEIFSFFKAADNVLLTPHVAGWTVESYEKISQVLFEKIKAI